MDIEKLEECAFRLGSKGEDYESVRDMLAPAARSSGLEEWKIETTIRSGYYPGKGQRIDEEAEAEEQARQYHLTDLGNAKRLVRDHEDEIVYCFTRKKWLNWNGFYWEIDQMGEARRLAKYTVAGIYGEARNLADETKRKALAKHAMQSESKQRIEAMLDLAKSEREFAKTIDYFDQDKWLLGVRNGTINLKTCEFQESEREDMISMCAGARFDPNAKCERWEAFLKEVLVYDELIAYIQREVGHSLTGDTSEQSFRFLYGNGANGKTVFITVIHALLGDYAENTPFTTFLSQRSDTVRNDIAGLHKARFVTAAEPRKGARLDLSVLKTATGGDPITARFLFANSLHFTRNGRFGLLGIISRLSTKTHTQFGEGCNSFLSPFTFPKKTRTHTLRTR
jgi:Predicted ATPase